MSVKLAVEKTIEYAKYFGCHINVNEIKKRLISKKIYSEELIDKEISRLNWKNKNNKWKKVKLNKARTLASQIENKFKDIIFLGVSGSVATGHPKRNDDIDILMITKNNTLWKNRFNLRWWMYKNKIPHRKYNKTELKDQFCFNLWLDENYLEIPKSKQNLNNAIDLILLKPLINHNMTYEKLLLINSWVKKFVATPYNNKTMNAKISILKTIKYKKLNKYINYLYFLPQYLYMKPKILREKIGFYQAFFHG